MSQSVQLVVGGIRYGGLMQNMECSNENEINNSTVHTVYHIYVQKSMHGTHI